MIFVTRVMSFTFRDKCTLEYEWHLALTWMLVVHWQMGVQLWVLFGSDSAVAAEDIDASARLLAGGEEEAWGESIRSLRRVSRWRVSRWRLLLRFLLNKGFRA